MSEHFPVDALLGLIDVDTHELQGEALRELLLALESSVQRLLQPRSDDQVALLMRIARVVIEIPNAEACEIRIRMLNDIGWVFRPLGRPAQGIVILNAAVEIAVKHGERSLERRSRSTLACLYNDAGIHSRAAEEAVKAAEIARELNDNRGCAAALLNLTSALKAQAMFRETISVCLRIVTLTKGDPYLRGVEAGAYGNLATAAYGLRDYYLGARTAERAVEVAGIPTDAADVLNVLAMEGIWIKNSLGKGEGIVARDRLAAMDRLIAAIDMPRFRINVELARAHCEVFDGELRVGVARLLGLLPKTSGVAPGLHIDNLDALIRAYEKSGDYDTMARYIAQLVSLRMEGFGKAIQTQLSLIGEQLTTLQPGKEDSYPLVHRVAHSGVPLSVLRDNMSFDTQQEMFERMAVTAELREDDSGTHAYRVGALARRLAERLGFGSLYCRQIEWASRLHDIGKLGVRDSVLNKPGLLNDAERKQMQKHTEYGARLLRLVPSKEFVLATEIAIGHHERWDGTGYPAGKVGEAIPEAARIAACADVWDALTHFRVYKEAWSFERTVKYFREQLGTQFDPRIGHEFVAMMEEAIATYVIQTALDESLHPIEASRVAKARASMRQLIEGLPYEWNVAEVAARRSAPA